MARPASGTNLSIAQLEQILRQRRSEQQRLEKKRSKVQRQLDRLDAEIAALDGGAGGRGGTGRVRNEKSLNEMIATVLGKSAKPMAVGDIEAAVRSAGYRSNSDQFRSIVNQALIKDKRFGAASRGMYQLKK
jgi:hypothetical protein